MKVFSLVMAMYFTLGSFFPCTDFSQLVKAPNMWNHYLEHREMAMENGDNVGFLDFLHFHFLSPSDHQGEHEHDNLPFHSISHNAPILLLEVFSLDWMPFSGIRYKTEFHYLLNYRFNYSASLFQPPVAFPG